MTDDESTVQRVRETLDCGEALFCDEDLRVVVALAERALSARAPDQDEAVVEAQNPETTLSSAALVSRANELARVMQGARGFEYREGYEFHLQLGEYGNPRAARAWELAVVVLEHLEGHEMADALGEVEEGYGR